MGYATYPATNPGWEISTILLCSYTVGYATYPVDGKSQQSCCVPTLWDMPPILQMGNLNNPVVFLHCGICHLILDGKSQQSCCVPTLWDMSPNPRWEILLCSYTSYFVGYITHLGTQLLDDSSFRDPCMSRKV